MDAATQHKDFRSPHQQMTTIRQFVIEFLLF